MICLGKIYERAGAEKFFKYFEIQQGNSDDPAWRGDIHVYIYCKNRKLRSKSEREKETSPGAKSFKVDAKVTTASRRSSLSDLDCRLRITFLDAGTPSSSSSFFLNDCIRSSFQFLSTEISVDSLSKLCPLSLTLDDDDLKIISCSAPYSKTICIYEGH